MEDAQEGGGLVTSASGILTSVLIGFKISYFTNKKIDKRRIQFTKITKTQIISQCLSNPWVRGGVSRVTRGLALFD